MPPASKEKASFAVFSVATCRTQQGERAKRKAWKLNRVGSLRNIYSSSSTNTEGSRGVPSHGGGTDTCTSGLCLARSQIRGMGLCDLTSGKPGEGYLGYVPYTETDQSSKEHPLLIVLV
ncbi:hypothetical protein CB1_000327009 [Camelus ferus]|nr:hypothetical protein CB1_000327009 [Camelus ferus]